MVVAQEYGKYFTVNNGQSYDSSKPLMLGVTASFYFSNFLA